MQLAFEIPILAYDLWTYKKGNHNTITCVCILADHFFVCGLLSIKEDVMVLVIISLVFLNAVQQWVLIMTIQYRIFA